MSLTVEELLEIADVLEHLGRRQSEQLKVTVRETLLGRRVREEYVNTIRAECDPEPEECTGTIVHHEGTYCPRHDQ